jgi:hypothetical protein
VSHDEPNKEVLSHRAPEQAASFLLTTENRFSYKLQAQYMGLVCKKCVVAGSNFLPLAERLAQGQLNVQL